MVTVMSFVSRGAVAAVPVPTAPTTDEQVKPLLRTPVGKVLAGHLGESAVHAALSGSLRAIDEALRASPLVFPPGMTDVFASGKRLRPLLVLAASRTAGEPAPGLSGRVVLGASAVELLHLASLVHDDIMDGAQTRHGVGTISARGGNNLALLAGDCLLGHAHAAAAALNGAASRLVGHTLVRLCEGQAEEWSTMFAVDRTVRSYYSAIGGKTASLFEAACRLGVLAAGHGLRPASALGRFGYHLGLGYQLRDDLLDLTVSAAAVGKPVGSDIANGVYTYPTLWALPRDPGLAALLRSLASQAEPRARPGLAWEATDRVRASGALDATRQAIHAQREQCVAALSDAVEDLGCQNVELLTNLADAVLNAD